MKYFKTTAKIIVSAIESIEENEFEQLETHCVETLKNGGKIIVSGLGKNVPICDKFVGTLTSMGVNASFMHTNSAVHGDLGLVHKGDLVIILTKSGETVESVYLAELLEKRGCKTWLMSFNRNSTLYNKIENHLIINLEHEGDKWDILPNHSTTMNLIVLQELAMNIIDKMEISVDVLRDNHPGGAIGVRLKD